MTLITVTKGGPDIEAGVYAVYLGKLEGPKTVTAQRGPNAGQDIELFDWTFVVDDGPSAGTEIEGSTSTASGPKSKMFAWLTALLNGRPPQAGQGFNPEDLVGLRALATISIDESGWPRIQNLGAIPVGMLATKVAQATGAPVTNPGAPGPVAAPVAAAPTPAPVAADPAGTFVMPAAEAPTDALPF